MIRSISIALLLAVSSMAPAQVKILFDATKAETAGNADWIVDADSHNLDWNPGASTSGGGNESNAQHFPTPAQSGITSATAETYWAGSLSSWGVAMAKLGYIIETLPYNGQITYGNSSNAQDLSHYKVFIIVEPNILFTAAEKTAIINFVSNGGGLFMISDHDVSDRNGDGDDSPHIWNDLMATNTVTANPFGITFDYQNYSETTSNFAVLPGDSILHGSQGNPTQMKISNGTTMSLSSTINPNVKPLVYKTGASNTGLTNVFMCSSRYGNGRVAALGDSSPPDDGTGDPNDNLYTGWSGEVNGDHARIILNATIWLATTASITTGLKENDFGAANLFVYPNPAQGRLHIGGMAVSKTYRLSVFDARGKEIASGIDGQEGLDVSGFSSGLYFYRITGEQGIVHSGKFIIE